MVRHGLCARLWGCPRKVRARNRERCSGDYKINPAIPGSLKGCHQACRARLAHPSAPHSSGRSERAAGTIQWAQRSVSRRNPLQVTTAMGWEGRQGCGYHARWQSRGGQSPQTMCGEASCTDFVPALASGPLLSAFAVSELRAGPLYSVYR